MALTDFVSYMKSLEDIGLAETTIRSEDDPEKRDKASAYLERLGAETIVGLIPGLDLSTLNTEQRKQYANQGLAIKKLTLTDQVGSSLAGKNLESLLSEINPEALEQLAFENPKELARGEVRGYEGLLQKNQEYLAVKNFETRYKQGKADPKELQVAYASVADEVVEEVKGKNEGKVSKQTLDYILQVAKQIISNGGLNNKEILDRGVKKLVVEAENGLRKYEGEVNKKIADYVKQSIVALRNDPDPEDSVLARSLIYEAAKKSYAKDTSS